MKQQQITAITLAACLAVFANGAAAECIAVYKAKQDNPLRLEQSSMEVSGPCSVDAAEPEVKEALAERGWTLLKILSVSSN